MESLVQTVRTHSEDVAMEFVFQKCADAILKRGNTTFFDGIKLPEGRKIAALEQGEGLQISGRARGWRCLVEGDKWYKHVPGKVRESEKVKIFWDFLMQTD